MRLPLLSIASALSLVACGGSGGPPAGTGPLPSGSSPRPEPANVSSAAPPSATTTTSTATAATASTAPPSAPSLGGGAIVGADRDTHGCIGSAGYTWSELRKSCLRLFEKGLRLDPVPGPNGSEATISAFLVFATDDRAPAKNATIELFVPGETTGQLLARGKKPGGVVYEGNGSAYKATFAKAWTLEKDGKAAFTQTP